MVVIVVYLERESWVLGAGIVRPGGLSYSFVSNSILLSGGAGV
jgi:hypothetical protein